jgi:CRISPR/Cas system-associated protein Csm6
MTNKDFASVLAIAVEKKKLNKTKLVEEFINTHKGDAKADPILDPTKPTAEMVKFVEDFRKKRASTKDHQLEDAFTKIIENAPKKTSAPVKTENRSYRAQEH